MNPAISIVLPPPTIIIQLPLGYGQSIEVNFSCVPDAQHSFQQTNEIKQERNDIKEESSVIKKEADIQEKQSMKEEDNSDFDMEEYIFGNNPNIYQNQFSPISDINSENDDNNDLFVTHEQDEVSEDSYQKCLNELLEIVEYLKEDTAFKN